MSGGFFRGTTADQDTRFSNKQAKLLKSQKFPPELDHLVDITKVKMDVIRPWIATRATELLGFEDEVLINFVYGLLDGKEVDGKQIQIQLTGFMEKNTGKFMKELWSLLLSAQMNASGVPQQFLDAKEEEMKKKKAETDRITLEIQKRREKDRESEREREREKQRRNDEEADISRSSNVVRDPVSKHSLPRASSVLSGEEQDVDIRHGRKTKNRYFNSPRSLKSPHSDKHSPSSRRDSPLATRSSSKSFSKSRSYSEEKHKSMSKSVSPQSQRRSSSPERQHRSPRRRSISPVRRYRSPPRRSISPRRRYSRQGTWSPPRKRQRSPSPTRWRFPHSRRRSPVARHRSPSPIRRSPPRRRSPIRRRSPSPSRRRSPIRHRSPSPLRRRSPLRKSPRYRRRSPVHSARNRAADSQVSPRCRKRSRSPFKSQSPTYQIHRSLSPERDTRTNGVESRRYQNENASNRTCEKRSPLPSHDRELAEYPGLRSKVSDPLAVRLPISLRSPQRDSREQHVARNRSPVVAREKSPKQSESRRSLTRRDRSSPSLSESPHKQTKEHMPHFDNPETVKNEKVTIFARDASPSLVSKTKDLHADKGQKKFLALDTSPESYSPHRYAENQSSKSGSHPVRMKTRSDSEERKDIDLTERHALRVSPLPGGVRYGPGRARGSISPDAVRDRQRSTKTRDTSSSEEKGQATKRSSLDRHRVNSEKRYHSKREEYREPDSKIESVANLKRKTDWIHSDAISSDSGEPQNMDKHRRKKSERQRKDPDDSSESESQKGDRKEAKRRRKEEKRLHKEEKRRRREEKHRKKLERRANKQKLKPVDTVALPSDMENNLSDDSDGDVATLKHSHESHRKEAEADSEQKKLEFELRKKALESLKAKRAISH